MVAERFPSYFIFTVILGLLLLSPHSTKDSLATNDSTESSNDILHIAYFEAGPYWEFTLIQKEVIEALGRLGVLQQIRFDKRLRLSPGWDAEPSAYRAAAKKLMMDPSVDLIISMGTMATKALLAENNGHTPIVSMDVADPEASGIIDSKTGKGPINLTLLYTKDKWQQVFILFHQALPFKRLGIMYHDSPEGQSYSNLKQAREVARERGFTLIEYAQLDQQESKQSCAKGIQALIDQHIDAFYISALNCFDWSQANPRRIIDELNRQGILTFARDGTTQVRQGALMGLSTLDYKPLGEQYADRISRLLNLRSDKAPMVQEQYRPKITVNLDTARNIGIDAPLIVLITADELIDSTIQPVRTASADN